MKVLLCAGNKTTAIAAYFDKRVRLNMTIEQCSSVLDMLSKVESTGFIYDRIVVFGFALDDLDEAALDIVFRRLGGLLDSIESNKEILVINKGEKGYDYEHVFVRHLHSKPGSRFDSSKELRLGELSDIFAGKSSDATDGYIDMSTGKDMRDIGKQIEQKPKVASNIQVEKDTGIKEGATEEVVEKKGFFKNLFHRQKRKTKEELSDVEPSDGNVNMAAADLSVEKPCGATHVDSSAVPHKNNIVDSTTEGYTCNSVNCDDVNKQEAKVNTVGRHSDFHEIKSGVIAVQKESDSSIKSFGQQKHQDNYSVIDDPLEHRSEVVHNGDKKVSGISSMPSFDEEKTTLEQQPAQYDIDIPENCFEDDTDGDSMGSYGDLDAYSEPYSTNLGNNGSKEFYSVRSDSKGERVADVTLNKQPIGGRQSVNVEEISVKQGNNTQEKDLLDREVLDQRSFTNVQNQGNVKPLANSNEQSVIKASDSNDMVSAPKSKVSFDKNKIAEMIKRSKVFTITGNPRAGKSSIAANIGFTAQRCGLHTVILDLDFYSRGMALLFPQELNPEDSYMVNGISNALRTPYSYKSYVWQITGNLDILGMDLSVGDIAIHEKSMTTEELSELLAVMRANYDLILLDFPFRYTQKFSSCISLSDRIAYVTENDISSMVNIVNNISVEQFKSTVDYQLFRSKCGFILNRYDDTCTIDGHRISPGNFTLFLDDLVDGDSFNKYDIFGTLEIVGGLSHQMDNESLLCETPGFDRLFFDMLYCMYK